MATVQVLSKLGILIGSLAVGLLFFYMASEAPKEAKKQQIDIVTSQLINFVIFIWLGKIIYHLNLFMQDPLAVLAYPSNSGAFYIASILLLMMISYQVVRNKMNLMLFVNAFVPIFLSASFMYEFIHMTFYDENSLLYLALLMILLIIYLSVMKHQSKTGSVSLLLLITWATVQFIISFLTPYVFVFGFMLSKYFFLGIILLCSLIYAYNRRKKVV